jgi:hypothetical protein
MAQVGLATYPALYRLEWKSAYAPFVRDGDRTAKSGRRFSRETAWITAKSQGLKSSKSGLTNPESPARNRKKAAA